MADGLQPAWRTCSTPPSCPRPARSGRDPSAARVRLGSAAGAGWHSFKAAPRFLAELPGCLPPSSRGRQPLIWAYLLPTEYFFFVFAAASGKQMGWGGGRSWTPRVGALPGQGTSTPGPASAVSPCPFPKSVHRTVCPGPAAANSYLLGLPPLRETLHASPLVLRDQAQRQTPGYDIRAPQKPGLCCSPPSGSTPSSPQNDSPPPSSPSSPSSNPPAVLIHLCTQHQPLAHL